MTQGWASQAIFRVESSPSQVESPRFPSRVESSQVNFAIFFRFLFISLENVNNEFFGTWYLVPGFHAQKIE